MAVYKGNKKAKLYRGDYRPAELYLGEEKIAGYDTVSLEGESITARGTYQDGLDLRVCGRSEQETTRQGANLLDLRKVPETAYSRPTETGILVNAYGNTVIPNSYVVKLLKPNTTYYCKAKLKYLEGVPEGYTADYTSMLKGLTLLNGVDPSVPMTEADRSVMEPGDSHLLQSIFTTPENLLSGGWRVGGYAETHLNEAGDAQRATVEFAELIISETDVPYTPFVPERPGPDDPTAVQSVSEPDLMITGQEQWGSDSHTLPVWLRGIPLSEGDTKYRADYTDGEGRSWVSDEIRAEGAKGKVTLIRRIGEVTLTGNEGGWNVTEAQNGVRRCFSWNLKLGETDAHSAEPGYCSHYPVSRSIAAATEGCVLGYNNRYIYLRVEAERFADADSLTEWLKAEYEAGRPVRVQYIMEEAQEEDASGTEWGKALLAAETKPEETHIYTVSDIQPYIKAKIKVTEE